LGALGFQRFEPFLHGFQVVAQPHATHAGGRDHKPTLPQFVGDAELSECRLLDQAAKYRQLAETAEDLRIKQELLDLAAICEEVANNIEDRMPGG
jgi:hypothetical protein